MKWAVLIIAITSNALANILVKAAMAGGGEENLLMLFKNKCLSLPLLSGIACFALALAAYSYVLTKINLSLAYPLMTSLGFVIVILASWLFFKESITLVQVGGFILILSGVWLIAH